MVLTDPSYLIIIWQILTKRQTILYKKRVKTSIKRFGEIKSFGNVDGKEKIRNGIGV
jgi:hypothetical protein